MRQVSEHPPLADLVGVFDEPARSELVAHAKAVNLPAGAHVFDPGQPATAFLVVTSGRVRVQLTAENGREIMLYRVEAGQSCVLTTSSLMDSEAYAAEAICETDVEALALPHHAFSHLIDSSPAFRQAVLAAYAARVTDLILTIEETRLRRIDVRLAEALLARGSGGTITATHHDLAAELGTAREVISRTLKRFERSGAIALGRGVIEVRDLDMLSNLSREL
jgi:CRP/FNR family transcriptional regulator, anaerobic regulatory protein